MREDIIAKLKESGLTGRGGACFPTWIKWDSIKKEEGKKVYIIANGSEGEPGVFKDEYILKNYPAEFIGGIKVALNTFADSEAIIYLNHTYYDKYVKKLSKYTGHYPIKFFRKTARYIAGDETALMNHIEAKRDEPRIKPPFPTQSGLYGCPTLVNNIETYYRVFEVANNIYKGMTFFSVSGDVKKRGVFEFPDDYSIKKVLKETGNWPEKDFFVQLGGGAAGGIYLRDELDMSKNGAASIIVYDKQKTDLFKLMEYWANFYAKENCDKCTPCREGSMRILKMMKDRKIDYDQLGDIFFVLEKTSFCPLGRGMPTPYKTLLEKVLKKDNI